MAFSFRNHIYRHVTGKPYINRWLVFTFDLAMCGIGTLLAYFLDCSLQQIHFDSTILLRLELIGLLSATCGFLLFRTYKNIIRHTSFQSIWRIAASLCIKTFFSAFCFAFWVGPLALLSWVMVLGIDMMFSFCAIVLARLAVVLFYQITFNSFVTSRHKVLIYGADLYATSLSSVFKFNTQTQYSLAGYLKFSHRGDTYPVGDLPVFVIHHKEDLQKLVQKEEIEGILFVHQRDIFAERNRLIPYCMAHNLQMFTVPPLGKWESEVPQVRSLNISDLLGREEIHISTEKIAVDLKHKVVLVTGAAGSIGSELCRQIARFEVSTLVLFDNCETGVHNLRLELEENFPNMKLVPVVGDVRSRKRLEYIFGLYKPQIIFHAAAYKHVPLMESNPNEAFMVNVKGTRNVAHTALKFNAEKFVMISTDKAVNPTNVMGASKRLAEIYVQSLDHALKTGKMEGKTQYITTRFGNVLGSQGSVIPRFQEQIAKGGPLTVTHPEITRYFMTIKEACLLVLEASNIGQGGEIMVFDMGKLVKIADLAKKMIQLSGHSLDEIKIEYTGLRPGEKLYEEVLSSVEHTKPTSHRKIRIADARTYEFDKVVEEFDTLIDLASTYQSEAAVRQAKAILPEYISQNSQFSELDK